MAAIEGEEISSQNKNQFVDTAQDQGEKCHLVIVLGASGDLARKSIYPALWQLYKNGNLPKDTFIIGSARSKLTVKDIRQNCQNYISKEDTKEEMQKLEEFWSKNYYAPGSYTSAEDAKPLYDNMHELEKKFLQSDRTFYLALPPSVYKSVTNLIKENWMAPKGRTRIAIEKPFGRDLASSNQLDAHLSMFQDEEITRVDHYLCLEMVQAILTLRFSNKLFSDVWNNKHVASVMITFKEDFGTWGRGGYFDNSGIVRDVMQNHLLQILALVAMERPLATGDDEIRHEKSRLVRAILPVKREDIVLGQYIGDKSAQEGSDAYFGYTEDDGVPNDSSTPTFAAIVFYINNERWDGIPFIMRCGKATNEVKDEVRIQFKSVDSGVQHLFSQDKLDRNELVIQLKPKERISLRLTTKEPGLDEDLEQTELDLNYRSKFKDSPIIGPYERVFLSIVSSSDASHFVGREELRYSWKIFSPLLDEIEGRTSKGKILPLPYKFGSLGPKEADELCNKNNFILTSRHPW